MTSEELLDYNLVVIKIFIKLDADYCNKKYLWDCFTIFKTIIPHETKQALYYSSKLKKYISQAVKSNYEISDLVNLNNQILLVESKYLFDSYMLCLESNRPIHERFYLPRRKQLLPIVNDIQALVDDELDELFISMPPRTGKTTLILFFITWIIGKNSELSNLYSAYSDIITNAFYSGLIEILDDNYTYRWQEIFSDSRIAGRNAKEETLDINRVKRYHSITCRSLYGTLNGACDCNGFLVADDLIGTIEEALNPDRLISAWQKVDNNLIPRAKEIAKLLWIGTRWSLADPIGKRQSMILDDPAFANRRIKIVNLPALNDKEESNFDYLYNVGYSTNYYKQRKASFENTDDLASWDAQYQGQPIERSGLLFNSSNLKYFNGILPDGEPDRIFMPVDVAWGGGDYVSAPIFYQYGQDIYIPDVVFNNGDKTITRPLVINAIIKHKVNAVQVEANNGGDEYKEDIEEALTKKEYKCNITSKPAVTTTKKEIRIYDHAPEIRNFYYLEKGKRSAEYNKFMENLCSFTITGKNKHDDAPDSLAQGCDMMSSVSVKVEIMQRKF